MTNILKVCLLFISSLTWAQELPQTFDELAHYLGYSNYTEIQGLTSDEEWAIMSYGFTDEVDYRDINGYLRFGNEYSRYNLSEAQVQKYVNAIQSAARKTKMIPKYLVVYRGIKLGWREDKCFRAGEIISDKAFTSTTLNRKTAEHFAFKKESGKGAFLTLRVAEKQHGILISEYDEQEILFMPGREMTISNGYEKDGQCYATGLLR